MANVALLGAVYADVPAVQVPAEGGGVATFYEVNGSQTITQNGTYDVSALAEAVVNVSGGGGASNVVQGEFTVGETGAVVESVTIPYTGTGYPVAVMAYIKNGMYNSTETGNADWYNAVLRYAVGALTIMKCNTTLAPTYTGVGGANTAVFMSTYKNSTSSSTSYTRGGAPTQAIYHSSNPTGNSNQFIRFVGDGKTLKYYTANGTASSYGLFPGATYTYQIVYSE